jgi:ATP-dependent Clp protease ATP-binding subunit ClpE
MYVVDKHAAHERMIFEKLKSEKVPETQLLLSPVSVNLSRAEFEAVTDNLVLLEKAGFEIEEFGSSSVLVRAIPADLAHDDIMFTVCEIAGNLLEKGRAENEKLENVPAENYAKLAELKSRECKIRDDLQKLKESSTEIALTPDDLAAVIENWTKIPVKGITEFETNSLVNLEEKLHKNLIGQNEAVSAVARGIRRKRAGLSLKRRPASFIFVGPTGVGKTELVKQIAREVFSTEDALIRFDMSEFMEKHSASKLIGSPPGYVGYDDAGQLTEKVRRHPYSVILFDEIEKAHPDVFNMLLQILDDGRITDSHGKTVSFEDTIIIMTSNAGSTDSTSIAGFGADSNSSSKAKAEKALRQIFRPEFLNRIDEIVVFDQLTKDDLLKIADLMLAELQRGIAEKGISIEVTEAAKQLICDGGYSTQYGARPMRRYIERHVEDKLAQLYISGNLIDGSKAFVDVNDGKIDIVIK